MVQWGQIMTTPRERAYQAVLIGWRYHALGTLLDDIGCKQPFTCSPSLESRSRYAAFADGSPPLRSRG